ncbi:carboxypeptidase-like regulatory domain-containing protein [Dyella sp.]|uniref:carboxypeptidase-like regulatory domain-containing protein n=1 Tax=Dyella sp. TaxID=1869338 RepID=UPI002ED3D726
MKSLLLIAAAVLLTTPAMAGESTGYIYGYADPSAQIVVVNEDTSAVIGVVAKPDGTYRADDLAPGHYAITEAGEHHAQRHLSVNAGKGSNVDLAGHKG